MSSENQIYLAYSEWCVSGWRQLLFSAPLWAYNTYKQQQQSLLQPINLFCIGLLS